LGTVWIPADILEFACVSTYSLKGFFAIMLDQQQLITLKTVVNIIIPPDEDVGGWEGGVGDYLLHQFEGDLKHLLVTYEQGLLSFEYEARMVTGQSFSELDPQTQEKLMAKIERGEVQSKWTIDPAAFFAMLVNHCAEGFYSDPSNHGNRNRASWKMIGFEVTA
jgi:hypothetical protein